MYNSASCQACSLGEPIAPMPKISFTLNGKRTTCSYEPGMHFLEVLREECGIVSPKNGCAPEGTCGCCAVLVDGRPALSCLRKPEQIEGHDVVTLEGIPGDMREVLGEAFVHEGGVQCGFCIPGIVVRASSMLRQGCTDDREAVDKRDLPGHPRLCRVLQIDIRAGEVIRYVQQTHADQLTLQLGRTVERVQYSELAGGACM